MTARLVTCRKCGKIFDYNKTDGVCPKCARYYSSTNYNEEEALLRNIMAPADEDKCSYHGGHDRTAGTSGHSEMHHLDDRVNRTQGGNKKTKNKLPVGVVVVVYIIIFILSMIFSVLGD